MDLSSITDKDTSAQEQEPALEYTAQVAASLISGEAKLTIGESSLIISALFDTVEVPFAEINALAILDYAVTIQADSGAYTFSKMGNWCQPFYDALYAAYNKAVLGALFIAGEPIITAKGDYHYTENGLAANGKAPVFVYQNSVVVLPPDLGARRVPLCSTSNLSKGDFQLNLELDTDENYSFLKLGYDSDPFAAAVEKQIRALRAESLQVVQEIDPALTETEAAQIAKLMPQGAAVAIGQLALIAPSFVAALETALAQNRAADSYAVFKELSDPAQIYIGFKKNEATAGDPAADDPAGSQDGGIAETSGIVLDGLTGEENPTPNPYLLWLIAPSPDGQFAAVEFAEANSATFVYRTGGDFCAFAKQLNRALEAISFKREVIRLTDEELHKPENADYYMASKRTVALQFIRNNFAGRIIHSNAAAWKKSLLEYFSGDKSGDKGTFLLTPFKRCQ